MPGAKLGCGAILAAGPGSSRGLANAIRRPIPRGRARSRRPIYFFFFAAFFLVAFFFAAFFFAIPQSPPRERHRRGKITFTRRNTGGGRHSRGRGGAFVRRPSAARGLACGPAALVPRPDDIAGWSS